VLLALSLFGCGSASVSPTPASPSEAPATPTVSQPATSTAIPDYVTEIRNAQYQLGATDALRVVSLKDGKFEQGTPGGADYVSVNVTDFVSAGDLNGDNKSEVVALVAENYGGSGVFTFLAVYADVNGTLAFETSALVDDRPSLKAMSVQNGEIFLDAVIHASDDPLCCPTLRINRHYRLVTGNQLDMTDYSTFTPDGRPRIITIEAPADGTEVYGSLQMRGRVSIAPFENNLAYRVYDTGGVELGSGSITVTATDLGGPGTFNQVVALGNILSGALVRVEVQDISAKDGSLLAMDSVELVVK